MFRIARSSAQSLDSITGYARREGERREGDLLFAGKIIRISKWEPKRLRWKTLSRPGKGLVTVRAYIANDLPHGILDAWLMKLA